MAERVGAKWPAAQATANFIGGVMTPLTPLATGLTVFTVLCLLFCVYCTVFTVFTVVLCSCEYRCHVFTVRIVLTVSEFMCDIFSSSRTILDGSQTA